nr:metal-dependent phosphohydrolase [Gammaproteobacteria bacterium]
MTNLTIDHLFTRLAERGTGAYGLSDVTQLDHALQSAALAQQQGLSDAMIIAALFHDVGHLVYDQDVHLAEDGIDDKHEESSANALLPLFGEAVSEPVRLHVASKRYLCSTED